jgi:cystathionine gamma-lyase
MSSKPDLDAVRQRFARALHLTTQTTAENGAFGPPIVSTSIYSLPGTPQGPHQYGRWSNPTWQALEDALAALEEAPTVLFPSGMAAIGAVFHSLLKSGDKLIVPADGYYTTRVIAEKYLKPMGVTVEVVPTLELPRHALRGARMVFVETPTNPGLDLADIAAVSAAAHAAGALLVVDNTMMTPLGQQPLDLGADIVVSADTKGVNGHSDVLLGHVASRDAGLLEAVRDWRKYGGAIPGAFEAWLVHRGLETLELRFERMSSSAAVIAERLGAAREVTDVRYPGSKTHAQFELAQRQMLGGGGIVAFTLPDAARAEAFVRACEFIRAATSFGGVHSAAERRARWGDAVAPGFVRLSVGCEPTEILWGAIERALAAR